MRLFVNTRDIEASTDALSSLPDLQAWFLGAGLLAMGDAVTPADLHHAVALREALRAALTAQHSEEPVPANALSVLNAAVDRAGLSPSFTADSTCTVRPRAGGADGALGALVAHVVGAMADGSWGRLKVCANDTCQWAFYDYSRARVGKWCSMQICGNRAKQQAWRARHDVKDPLD